MKYPENSKEIYDKMPPEKFVTTFNRRVYQVIMGRIIDGKPISPTDIAEGFSVEEISAIAKILARFNSVSVTRRDADEYINVINQEFLKRNVDTASAETQDLQSYLRELRSQKK
jgi:DNA primase